MLSGTYQTPALFWCNLTPFEKILFNLVGIVPQKFTGSAPVPLQHYMLLQDCTWQVLPLVCCKAPAERHLPTGTSNSTSYTGAAGSLSS
jgi:hypothetical protein